MALAAGRFGRRAAGCARRGPADWLVRRGDAYAPAPDAPDAVRALLDLYAPLCSRAPARSLTVRAPGPEPRRLHRDGVRRFLLRDGAGQRSASAPAARAVGRVVVGAGTVARDDPQLTVRHVAGPNPVRVVLDPSARLDAQRRVFTDGAAPTLVVHAAGLDAPAPGSAEILHVPVAERRAEARRAARAAARARPVRSVRRRRRLDGVAVSRSGAARSAARCDRAARDGPRPPGSHACRRASASPSACAPRIACSRWAATCCSTAICAPPRRRSASRAAR